MTRIVFALLAGLLIAAASPLAAQESAAAAEARLPTPTPSELPQWRGFNLLEKFQKASNEPFREQDFQLIRELGFNFVRLPMDYRCWIEDGDWTRLHEPTLREIDQAVEFGGKYSIHVCINFHRAPGYTVAQPPEAKSLWTDPEAQRVCAMHWAQFARRYRGIPSERLSFNLFNEPSNVEPEVYAAVVKPIVAAIRAEDPQRLIISDGLQWGQRPALELAELKLAQATRGYAPSDVTHYKASWMSGSDRFPLPTWPRLRAYGTLYAPNKAEVAPDSRNPLVIERRSAGPATLRVHVMTVSTRATLVVRVDGEPIWEKQFVCGPGEGEWKKAEFRPQWNVYQNIYDRDYTLEIPGGSGKIELALREGDWLEISEIGLQRPGEAEDRLALRSGWDQPPARVTYQPEAAEGPFAGEQMEDRRWLWETMIVPWKEAQQQGIGVVVGEFGCYNKTPHDVVLRWMEDCLQNWQQAGWGWALWNFRGSFGILDSGRADVQYEPFHDHQLDRKMLELLQRY